MNAVEKRSAAVQSIIDSVIIRPETMVVLRKRKDICRDIMALEKMGRTEKWQTKVAQWSGTVYTARPEDLRWAVLEYGTHCQGW